MRFSVSFFWEELWSSVQTRECLLFIFICILFCLEKINKTLHLHHLRVQIFPVWVGCNKEEKLQLQPWCSLTVFLATGNILLLLVLGIFKHVSLFFSFSRRIFKFKKKRFMVVLYLEFWFREILNLPCQLWSLFFLVATLGVICNFLLIFMERTRVSCSKF